MISDKELLRAAQKFDLSALAEIYDQFSPAIYRYAMRFLGDSFLAEECVADTFDRFLRAIKQGGGPRDALQAYLFRVAHNWITDYYRRKPFQETELQEDIGDEPAPAGEAPPASASDLRNALRFLTEDQRAAVVLKFLEGWTNEQIARFLDKPVGAVKALQHRGLANLRKRLDSDKERDGS